MVPSLLPTSSQGNASMAALPPVKIPLINSADPFTAVSMAPFTVSAKVPHSWAWLSWSPLSGGLNSAPKNADTLSRMPVMALPTRSAKLPHRPLMAAWSPSSGGLNSPPRKVTTASNAPVMALPTVPAKVSQAPVIVSCMSSGTPSRSMMVLPMVPSPLMMLSRISLPSCSQSVAFRPSQIAVTISGSFSTSRGMP